MSRHPSSNATIVAGRWAAALLVAQFVLMWATFFVLSAAIGWPASLDDPAALALPRLAGHRAQVAIGYGSYLTGALMMVPAIAALCTRMALHRDLAALMIGIAAMATVAKAIGICRWLFAMPALATAWVTPGSDQRAIALVYRTLNDYAGGIGEVIGVGLLSGLLTIMIGFAVVCSPGRGARAVGGYAILAGAGLLLAIPAGFGVELGPILTVTNIAWQFALLGIGLWSLTSPRA